MKNWVYGRIMCLTKIDWNTYDSDAHPYLMGQPNLTMLIPYGASGLSQHINKSSISDGWAKQVRTHENVCPMPQNVHPMHENVWPMHKNMCNEELWKVVKGRMMEREW